VGKRSVEHFCEGCNRTHTSDTWYYRYKFEKENAEWMCGITYLRLSNLDMSMWRSSSLSADEVRRRREGVKRDGLKRRFMSR
jgi:hypothetical protein